jgi:amino acid adenylation domain-containing protein
MSIRTDDYFAASQVGTAAASNLVELLRARASSQPARLAYTFLVDGEAEESTLTYLELDRQARTIAAYLQILNARGERILLLYPPGLDYIAAFFGCLYAGAIAVPSYPPRLNQSLQRIQAIVADSEPMMALTTASILAKVDVMSAQAPELKALRWLATDRIASDLFEVWRGPGVIDGSTLAFLQYTSGSTAKPKGVMVTHQNLMCNGLLIQTAFRQDEHSVIVGWLPLYHDMGLIGNVLQPLLTGARCVLMSPMAFLQSPFRWLDAISRYGATTSGGPNFAYDLCVRKISAERRATLDLSSWTTAFNGAEPVRPETLERFAASFEACGFRREAFQPCYGLAEGTLLVSASKSGDPFTLKAFDSASLKSDHAVEAPPDAEGATHLVGCGAALAGEEVTIVDPESLTRCGPGRIGEIWVSGPSVTQGYWGRSEETAEIFQAYLSDTGEGPFLRTGDLGVFLDGELFVTGRLKDLIIIRGLNHYPQDIELTVESTSKALRPGCGAAFSVEVAGAERLVVVQEADVRQLTNPEALLEEISRAVTQQHEVQPSAIVLVKPGSVPKTSSGKIQRHACRANFLAGSLQVLAERHESDGEQSEVQLLAPTALGNGKPDVEQWLVAQLAAKLRVNPSVIDVNHTMVRYGLDSLAAIELMHNIESGLGVTLPLMNFLAEFSIAELAARLNLQLSENAFAPAATSGAATEETLAEHPLSFGQQSIWFLHQLAPESPAYNIAAPLHVTGPLDTDALRRSFQALVDRHACLRTTFGAPAGEPVQHVHAHLNLLLREESVAGWSVEAVNAYLVEEAHRPFDLEAGPLVRVNVLARSEDQFFLLLVVHHIVADFWSLAVLMHELGELYNAERIGVAANLPALNVSYLNYVRWEAELLRSQKIDPQRRYWEERLAGELPVLNLPIDKPRPATQTFRGASELIILDESLRRQLERLSRASGATLYMTLLAAFEVLLYRYTGQEDFLVGSPTSGRSRAEWSRLVGYFVNPVALRADLTENRTFVDHLAEVRSTVLSAFEHQDYPFAALIEGLQLERDLSRPQLFEVMFVLQKTHLLYQEGLAALTLPGQTGARMRLEELELESVALAKQVAQFDLTLTVADVNKELAASMQYNTDLFRPDTIKRMLTHFRALLEEIIANPNERVALLSMLTPVERRQQLSEWNQSPPEGLPEICVQQLFEEQAEKSPDAPAVISKQERLTYGELNAKANQLASRLRALGIGPEVPVAVCLERSPDMIVSLLAVLKARGFYVPLDPAYPKERLAYMLADSGAPVLITEGRLVEGLPEHQAHVFDVRADWSNIEHESDANPQPALAPENLAYMIYTSGSTGQPKGVSIQHASLSALVSWHTQAYGVTSGERATQLASPAFDASVWELWPYLTAGASIHLPEDAVRASAPDLLKWLAEEDITICFLPTPLAEALLEEEMPSEKIALRAVLTGGDKLHHAPRKPLPFILVNHYGPTENTVVATRAPIATAATAEVEDESTPPIGRPITGTRAYVLDSRLQLLPEGVAGELYLSGLGLARGYHGRPEMTARKFIPDPFAGEPGARMYKTGDLVRYLPDGRLEFLGRIDNQVKISGFRIELGEIETTLLQHAAVREAVVVTREDAPTRKRLVAYIVNEEGESWTASDLRAYLRERLPDYMIPSSFVSLNELPLTPNGKVDRRALPDVAEAALEYGVTNVPPRTPVEELLAYIWCHVLNISEAGVHDNFFALGGHSLLATQVISRVRERFQVELPLRSLFESPTVAELAMRIEEAMKAGEEKQKPPIVAVLRDRDLPASPAQQRLWFLDRLDPNNAFYNIPAAVRLTGDLRCAELEKSVNEIVRRHESLRTTFATRQGRPMQVVAPALQLTMPLVDLSSLPLAARASEVSRLLAAEAQAPFDLSAGPLLRTLVLRLAADEHVLLLTLHHIVSDGWSIGILINELKALYEAYLEGVESPLPEMTIQYADFACWQQQLLEGEWLEQELIYWRQQLGSSPAVLELPTDRPRPAMQTYRGAVQIFALPSSLKEALKALSLSQDVTLFMTLLAAFQTLLHRYNGQTEINIGTPIAGRASVETENLIGLFLNTLVLRTDLSGNPRFSELLGRVRETALSAYVNQNVPFEKLVEELSPDRDLSHAPLFQVMFALQNAPAAALELPGISMERLEVPTTTAKFELFLSVEETEDALHGSLEYNTDLFDRSTIERLIEHFLNLLEAVVADPDQRIAALPLMGEAERQKVLLAWNDTSRDYPPPRLIHELVEQQAVETPEATAVYFGPERLTYGELNGRANQLAQHLRGLGVGPEVLVGVCMERSPEMVVALLAVLKAGGAYVPLDPAYPQERLALIADDARPSVLLTERRLRATLPSSDAHLIEMDGAWETKCEAECEAVSSQHEAKATTGVTAENLAYVIYTSGSTGKPKGVMISHRAVVNFLRSMQHQPGLTADDRLLAVTTISFDIAALELFLPLVVGGSVVLVSREVASDGVRLREHLESYDITAMQATPATWRLLLEAGWTGQPRLKILCGGEALAWDLAQKLVTRGASVWNMYGPTETTIWSAAREIVASDGRVLLGGPVANTQLYVLDRHKQLLPQGAIGELHIGGEGLARGYYDLPVLTAEKFIPDPFSNKPDARLYETGDLARFLSNGTIEYLGRVDHQVKLRGFRIELGEIEAALRQHQEVEQVVVVAQEGANGEKRLVAYTVSRNGSPPPPGELRSYLKEKLPEYMIPSAFVMLEKMPLTPNGKVDRRNLPAPDDTRREITGALIGPRTPAEETLANIWREVLGLKTVGVHDNFFELGGHSLLGAQVMSKLTETFRVELPLRTLFEAPTIAGLAAAIATAESSPAEPPPAIKAVSREAYRVRVPSEAGVGLAEILKQKRP